MMMTTRASLFITAMLLAGFTAGCKEDSTAAPDVPETAAAQETAAAPDATEEVDLSEAPDLFEEPLQPNPLAPKAEDVIVTVEGTDITYGEIMQAVQMRMQQMSQQVPPQQLSQMYGQVFQQMTDTLVANALLEHAAETSSLTVSDAELEEEIAEIKANAPEGQPLEEVLAENGVDINEWKENLRSQMLVGKLVEEKTADIAEPTSEEVAAFYQENIENFKMPESVTASHILIAFDEEDTDATKAEKREKIEALKEQIENGAGFAELATANSDCPSSQRGGDLGSFSRGQMVPEFEATAFNMETNTVSDVVETQFGYHLIKVTGHEDESVRSLPEVTEQLAAFLANQKRQEALMAYIDELKEAADIVMHEQDMDSGDGVPAE
ncbi:MAG TPA: peptidylprolyl isomerase [Tichowtungia sp.]|nr:peptidylprolyl isomerase [Tichowtungia sp.]